MDLKSELRRLSEEADGLDRAFVKLWLEEHRVRRAKNRLVQSYSDTADTAMVVSLREVLHRTCSVLDEDALVKALELSVPRKERKVNGTVYTPAGVKKLILAETLDHMPRGPVRAVDPSCGCGSFLMSLARALRERDSVPFSKIYRDSIFGADILSHNVERTKLLLSLLAVTHGEDLTSFEFNLVRANSLAKPLCELFSVKSFDLVVGNPPYVRGRNMDASVRKSLKKWKTALIGIPDLYIPFFELGLESLRPGGWLGYISSNTYLHSVNGRELRRLIAGNHLATKIVNFESSQLFEGVMSYTCITILGKKDSTHIDYAAIKASDEAPKYNSIPFDSLDDRTWILAPKNELKRLDTMRSVGPRLVDLFPIRNGIATLANDLYIFRPNGIRDGLLLREYDGKSFEIEDAICRNIYKPNIIHSEKDLRDNAEKVIFPYEKKGSRFFPISESTFAEKYPKAFAFLRAYRVRLAARDKGNGDYAAWYAFGRTQGFNTVGNKLLIPYITQKPVAVPCYDRSALLYCGYSVMVEDQLELRFIRRLIESEPFWFFIQHTSKPYTAGFMSVAKNYIGDFPIPRVSQAIKKELVGASQKVAAEIVAELYKGKFSSDKVRPSRAS